MPQTITSRTHPIILHTLKLHEKRGRAEHQQCIVEGARACIPFFRAGLRVYQLFVTEPMLSQVSAMCPPHKIVIVPDGVMEKISPSMSPSGMMAVFHLPEKPAPELLTDGLVLAQVQDPGNMGTLIRTAAALGSRSVVLVEGVEPWNPKVIQASAGTIAQMHIFQWTWAELLERRKDYQLVGMVVTCGKRPDQLMLDKSLLVVGNEANGLPAPWQASCDALLTLPMPGGTESLNAAIAGSIALYYSYMQRTK